MVRRGAGRELTAAWKGAGRDKLVCSVSSLRGGSERSGCGRGGAAQARPGKGELGPGGASRAEPGRGGAARARPGRVGTGGAEATQRWRGRAGAWRSRAGRHRVGKAGARRSGDGVARHGRGWGRRGTGEAEGGAARHGRGRGQRGRGGAEAGRSDVEMLLRCHREIEMGSDGETPRTREAAVGRRRRGIQIDLPSLLV
nr:uncharacterized protein LOC127340180 [Lolium perenne]